MNELKDELGKSNQTDINSLKERIESKQESEQLAELQVYLWYL